MKEMLKKARGAFAQNGYRKRGNSFYKTEDGFYKLVSFQKGAYGDYFFINAGLHPVGLPLLQADTLQIPDHPKEYECALRERIGQIVTEEKREIWSKAQNWIGSDMVPHIIDAIGDIEAWFQKWGSFQGILDCSFDEISDMFSAVPLLWEKEYLLLKFYAALQVGDIALSRELFRSYSNTVVQNLNFERTDSYLQSMLVTSTEQEDGHEKLYL